MGSYYDLLGVPRHASELEIHFHDAATIAHDYSLLSATSPASAFEALDNRWKARLDEATALSDRFQAQETTGP